MGILIKKPLKILNGMSKEYLQEMLDLEFAPRISIKAWISTLKKLIKKEYIMNKKKFM